jgi:hypothetical protein
MIISFTKSRGGGNFFSQAIAAFEKSPWTHVVIRTGVKVGGDELILHSQWDKGLVLDFWQRVLGSKESVSFKTPIEFNWSLARQALSKYSGFHNYGWAQVIGHVYRSFNIPEPQWLVKRYDIETYCSEVILIHLHQKNLFVHLDVNRTGPGDLFRACEGLFEKEG